MHLIPTDKIAPQASQRFTAFGELPTKQHVPWGFSGKRHDPETGFVYFGQRYYIPELGRWLTSDPLFFEDGLNLYAYVGNRPLLMVDPYGLYTLDYSTEDSELHILKMDEYKTPFSKLGSHC